jgi:hypothetical protein
MTNHRAIGADHGSVESFDREFLTRVQHDVLVLSRSQNFLIGLIACSRTLPPGHRSGLAIGAMIEKRPDGDLSRKLGHAADVVRMVVRDQHIVQPRNTGLPGRGNDAVCIAVMVAGPSCIDQERVPTGGNEECRLAALDIDKVDLQLASAITLALRRV